MQNRLLLSGINAAPETEGRIGNTTLILVGFASAFFPRLLASMGIPAVINFVHFGLIPGAFFITVFTTKTRDKKKSKWGGSCCRGWVFF